MPFAGYDDWKDSEAYSAGDIVFYNNYLYIAMTSCDAGDDPLTATYTQYFEVGDFGFNKVFPTEEEPDPDNTYSQTMRKWTIYDLPFGYYYSKLCGLPGNNLQESQYSNVGTEVMVLNVYRLGGPDDGLDFAKIEYNWSGYGLPHGLNSKWPDPDYVLRRGQETEREIESELVYHISFVPMDFNGLAKMPKQYGDETVSGLAFQSHLYQYNTTTFYGGDYYGAENTPYESVRMATLFYATFSRSHNYIGDPSGSDSVTSPTFADNYEASVPSPPVTDPPTQWYLTGITPNHPD